MRIRAGLRRDDLSADTYKLVDDRLYRYESKFQNEMCCGWKMCIPTESVREVCIDNHDRVTAAHGGYHRTLSRIRERYFWPTMKSDVRQYVNKCEVCKRSKATNMNQTSPMGEYREAERPFQIISCDFMGPYTRSKSGNRFLFVCVDLFSKYVIVKAIRNSSAAKTVEIMKNEVFLKFGVPEIVISDNGPQLRSDLFVAFLAGFHVKHWLTASYHPQANPTEAANKTIITAIRSYIVDKTRHDVWDAHVPELEFALNSSLHTTTKYSPHHVLYGQNLVSDGREHGLFERNEQEDRMDLIERIRMKVSTHLREAYETNKQKYDRRSNEGIEYGVGETIYRRNMTQSSAMNRYTAKFGPKYIPTVVRKRVGTNTYELVDVDTGHTGIFHTKFLKR